MHSQCDTDKLQDDRQAADYYDNRYEGSYMQDWPVQKLDRVRDLIRGMGLGERGVAVDLGCGVGVFSRVLKDALPGWDIIGLEISPKAIAAAKATEADIDFRQLQDADLSAIHADFVFSHHVLEHVIDLDVTWHQLYELCKPGARVLHILPCGDARSFEHRLATRTQGGIDPAAGNRFFYEDAGHVRRLTWQGLCDAASPMGFTPEQVRYANQFWGGLSWISKIAPDKAAKMARPGQAIGTLSKVELAGWRFVLVVIATMNRWASVWDWRCNQASGARGVVARMIGWPTGLIGKAVCGLIDRLAQREWRRGTTDTGSEMYAVLRLNPSAKSEAADQRKVA